MWNKVNYVLFSQTAVYRGSRIQRKPQNQVRRQDITDGVFRLRHMFLFCLISGRSYKSAIFGSYTVKRFEGDLT